MISLKSAALLDAAKKMEDAANRIDAAIINIDNIISDLETVWNDENARKYLSKYEELKESFPAFKMAAHNYSAFLYKVVDTYRKEYLEPTSESVS